MLDCMADYTSYAMGELNIEFARLERLSDHIQQSNYILASKTSAESARVSRIIITKYNNPSCPSYPRMPVTKHGVEETLLRGWVKRQPCVWEL